MKKHSLAMVFLLILTLCLTSAVSASDDAVVGDAEVFESQGEMEMDFAQSDEIIEDRWNCHRRIQWQFTTAKSNQDQLTQIMNWGMK